MKVYLYLVVFVVHTFFFLFWEFVSFKPLFFFSTLTRTCSLFIFFYKGYFNKYNISTGVMGLYLTISMFSNRDYKLAWWLCYHGTYFPSLVHGSIFITALLKEEEARSVDSLALVWHAICFVSVSPSKIFPMGLVRLQM